MIKGRIVSGVTDTLVSLVSATNNNNSKHQITQLKAANTVERVLQETKQNVHLMTKQVPFALNLTTLRLCA